MIEAVIFDMDGVLIDSEPFWQESEMDAFARVGLRLTHEMCAQTMGLRVDEVVDYWHRHHAWEGTPSGELEEAIIGGVAERILSKGEAKEGVARALDFFRSRGVKVALASSSAYRLIRAVTERFGLSDKFDCVYSAEDEEYGKPHPGVYLTTARRLNVSPAACLAVEDSFNGVLSAKAARMKCIAVPEEGARHDPRFQIADVILGSLEEIDEEVWRCVSA
ncbi:MAG TPA: hexitol phosphatase HxpB [Pyrinomonadaceae bacterium]|jgi:sugar-phosphatase|nr:hexitol phosphatase HxpB [Pyrinomonadaceae bacterium]